MEKEVRGSIRIKMKIIRIRGFRNSELGYWISEMGYGIWDIGDLRK